MSGLRRRYCVFGCDITLSHRVPLHRLPNPDKRPDMFAAWVSCVGDILTEHDTHKIYNNKRICDHHFDSANKTTGSRLIASAIPTILKRVSHSLGTIANTDHNYCRPRREYQGRPLMDITNLTSQSVPAAVVDLESAPGPSRVISTPSTGSCQTLQFDLDKTRKYILEKTRAKCTKKRKQMQNEIRRLRNQIKSFKMRLRQTKGL